MSATLDRQKEIFEEALALSSAAARSAYLTEACGNDDRLRSEIEALLEAHEEMERLFPPRLGATSEGQEFVGLAHEGPGTILGRYKLLQKIGEGGMGTVYMAEQETPVRRRVALKIIKLGMDTRQVVARFEAERQALALMDHPNIARVLDAGATEQGRPYFVMELVQGVPITEFCDQHRLTPQARLKLFIQVCQAIQSAHQKGIIHRDIKPSNILVSLHQEVPVPKVIDFGVAKATHQKLTEKTLFTRYATLIGTPAYMSPEQAQMSSLDLDTRTDVYSLGVLLYELLTATTPFPDERLRQAGYAEIQRIIAQEEPERPSTRLTSMDARQQAIVASNRGAQSLALKDSLVGDLDWVVMKCLEKNRSRRYETANGLALDIQRYLQNEPVTARPPTRLYQLQKFVRRNRVLVGAGVTVVLALVAGLGLAAAGFFQANQKLARALRAEKAAREAQFNALENARQAKEQSLIARKRAYTSDMDAAVQAVKKFNVSRALGLLRKYVPRPGDPDLRGFEWRYLWGQCQGDSFATLRGHTQGGVWLSFAADGRNLLSFGGDGFIRVWDVAQQQEVANWRAQTDAVCVAFSQRDPSIALESRKGHLTLWSGTRHQLVQEAQEGKTSALNRVIALSADGKLLATADQQDASVRLWSVPSLQPLPGLGRLPEGFCALAFSPDGEWLAAGGFGGSLKLWNLRRPQTQLDLPPQNGSIHSITFSPDGRLLVAGTWREGLKVYRIPTRDLALSLDAPWLTQQMAFSPDGQWLGVLAEDSAVRLWKMTPLTKADPVIVFPGHSAGVASVAFSPDGQTLATGGWDHAIRLTRAEPRPEKDILRGPDDVLSVALSPDNRTIASGSVDGTVRLWDGQSSQLLATFQAGRPQLDWIWTVAFSADGKRVAAGGGVCTQPDVWGPLKIWDVPSRQEIASFTLARGCLGSVQFGPDGHALFSTSNDQTVRQWDFSSGTVQSFSIAKDGIAELSALASLAPDGQTLATVGWGTGVKLWAIPSGKLRLILTQGPQTYYAVRFSPDGRWLAAGRADGKAELWDTRTWTFTTLDLQAGTVWAFAFSADGKTLATGCDDPVVQLWSLENFERVGVLPGHTANVQALDFSADGTLLISGSSDRTIHIWRAPTLAHIDRLGL